MKKGVEFPCILSIIGEKDLDLLRTEFEKDYFFDDIDIIRGKKVKANELLEGLERCLENVKSLELNERQEKSLKNKLKNINQIEDVLTELFIANVLLEKNFPVDLEYEYATKNGTKDLDIITNFGDRDLFFEVVTRRDIRPIKKMPNIDRIHLKILENKYKKKEIEEAVCIGSLKKENPIIFVMNTKRSLPQSLFTDSATRMAANYFEKCRYLSGVLMFRGYVFLDRKLLINEKH